ATATGAAHSLIRGRNRQRRAQQYERVGHSRPALGSGLPRLRWGHLIEGDLAGYRCHVGHTYTAELMSLALDESLRRALGSAQRAPEERVAPARKLYDQAP